MDVFVFFFLFWQNGTADAASMSADDIYAAGLCHGLELAAGESYNGVGRSQQRTRSQIGVMLLSQYNVAAAFRLTKPPSRRRQLLRGGHGAPLLLRPVPAGDARAQLLSSRHTHHRRVDGSHWLPGQHLPDQRGGAMQFPQR